MKINDLTIGDAKKLAALFGGTRESGALDSYGIGEKVIIRTFSAGVWFGELSEKAGKEVILKNARRMWRWHAAESISLSAVAVHGINQDKSQIAPAVDSIWLEAIEILPTSAKAAKTLEGAKDAKTA